MTGKVTISLDFEAGWGVVGNGSWRAREAAGVYRNLRPALRRFVSLLDDLEISCIWATVGAMIEDPSERDFSHLKGAYASKVADFVAQAEGETHLGLDLLETVMSARQKQYFGTHGYSHVLFTDSEQDETVFRVELERARRINASFGLDANFFVFPENRSNHLDVVSDAGIRIARMPAVSGPFPDRRRRAVRRMFDLAVRPVSSVSETVCSGGLRLHHASELVNWGTSAPRIKKALMMRRIERAIQCAKSGQHVHFWLHPFDLVATEGLEEFWVAKMNDIASARNGGSIMIKGRF